MRAEKLRRREFFARLAQSRSFKAADA